MKPSLFVKSLLALMIFCNLYAFFVILSTEHLDASYPGHYLQDPVFAVVSLLSIVFFYLISYQMFKIGTRLKSFSRVGCENLSEFSLKRFSIVVVAFQLIYLYAIVTEGAGSAGGVVSDSQTILSSVLTVFRVDDFALLFMLTFSGALYFRTNLFLYFVSFVLRGWLGVFISGIIVAIYKYKIKLKSFKVFFVAVFAAFVLSLFPFLMSIRSEMRLSDDALLAFYLIDFSEHWDVDLLAGLHGVLMRFQQIESLIYFLQNLQTFQGLYDRHLITPVFFDGPLLSGLFKQFYHVQSEPLGLILADNSRELVYGRKTAVSPGLITYFLLDFVSVIYILFVPLLYGYATTFFSRSSAVTVGCFYFLIFYFSFGWSNAVVGSFFSLFLFVTLSRFFARSKNYRLSS